MMGNYVEFMRGWPFHVFMEWDSTLEMFFVIDLENEPMNERRVKG
jgi:hypothetical protein